MTTSSANFWKINGVKVGCRLQAIRMVFGLQSKDMAALIAVDPSSYSKTEKGSKPLKSEHAYVIAERYGITMDYIYRGSFAQLPTDLAAKLRRAESQAQE